MVSRKMKEDLINIITSFYSFKDLDECKKKVEEISEKIGNLGGRKILYIDVNTYKQDAKRIRQRLTVDEFMHGGFEMSSEIKVFDFELGVKCVSPDDLVSTIMDEKVFKSHYFVPTDDMHAHGKAEKLKTSKDVEFYFVDKY